MFDFNLTNTIIKEESYYIFISCKTIYSLVMIRYFIWR